MSRHLNRSRLRICSILGAISLCNAQSQVESQTSQTPEDAATVSAAVADGLDRKLYSQGRDELYILAMRHSKILVPEVAARIQAALADQPSGDGELVARLADILAYAGDETAIDALTQLCVQNEKRFGYYIERVLGYSEGRRNAYGLAYYALRKPNRPVEASVMKWIEGGLSLSHYQRAWAQALFERYRGFPSESELGSDPVVSRLPNGLPLEVRSELFAVAKEAQARRESR